MNQHSYARPARKSLLSLLLSIALMAVLVACGRPGTGEEEPPPEPLTREQVTENVTELNDELLTVISDFEASVPIQLVSAAFIGGQIVLPNFDLLSILADSVTSLPRGNFQGDLNDDGTYDWRRVGDLPGPGELRFNNQYEVTDLETEVSQFSEVVFDIDWQAGGAATKVVELESGRVELPRSLTAQMTHDSDVIADLAGQLEPETLSGECTDGATYSYLVPADLLLNGTLGMAGDLLLNLVDIQFDVDTNNTEQSSSGHASAEYLGHSAELDWSAELTADFSDIEAALLDFNCGVDITVFPDADLSLVATAVLNDFTLDLDLSIVISGDRSEADVDITLDLNGAEAFRVLGIIELTSDEDLTADLLVHFADERITLTEFIEELEEMIDLGLDL